MIEKMIEVSSWVL